MRSMSVQLLHYDSERPLPTLEAAGVRLVRTPTSNNVRGDFADISGLIKSGERFEFTLPESTKLTAAFGQEGVVKKLLKFFQSELQVGDPAFDDAVFISTGDEEATERFLEDKEVRELIMDFVRDGGSVVIEGKSVIVDLMNKGLVPLVNEPDVARFVCHVMAFRERVAHGG